MIGRRLILRLIPLEVVLAAVLLTLLLPYFAPPHAQAQPSEPPRIDPTHLVFETVAGDYGSIFNVIQDKDGFLWLAGINGALKYNGYKAETVFSGEAVSALFEDSQGLIWTVVGSGLAVYDKGTGGVTRYIPDSDDPTALSGYSRVAYQKTQLLTEDRDGFIWIATMNGLNRFDKKNRRFAAYKSKIGDATTLLDNDVWSVLTARDGSLWVGTASGLHQFDPRTGRVLERYATDSNDPDALQGKYAQATVEDDQGVIWVGTTEGGLNRLDPKEKTFSHYRADATGQHRIANNFIYRLAHFAGAPDLIWITTVNGLSLLNKRDNTVTNYIYNADKADKGGLGAKIVHTIIQDRSGIFWLVVNEHGFLQKIDPGSRQFQSILRSKNPEEGFVDVTAPLRLGPDGNIWVNEVTTGIARVDPQTGRIINHFLHNPQKPDGFPAQLEDFDFEPRHKDIIWAVAKGVVVEYNWSTQTVVNKYRSGTQAKIWPIWTDKQNPDLLYGNVWGKGLLRFNKQTGKADIFTADPNNPEETLTGHTVFPLLPAYYQMDGNQIWLNTAGVGFDLFDLNTGKVVKKHLFDQTNFTRKEFDAHAGYIDSKGRFWMGQNQYDPASGEFTSFKSLYGYSFPSTAVCVLAEDSQGRLWAAGFLDGTLTRIDPQTGETRVFTERDGVSPGLGSACAPVTLPDGQIWMAGTGGVTSFYPDQIVNNPYQAPVHITKLMQGSKPLQLGMAPERAKEITLNWDENYFEFEMTALSYRHPEENRYQYMLEGVDKEWYSAGNHRSGRYSGLPHGTYTLRVRASNNDGVWSNQEASLTITITPPWWATWWFRGTALVALLALVLTGYRLRVRRIKQRSRELERQVAERTAELLRQKIFTQAVLEHINDGIVACNERGTLSYFNRATRLIHGIDQEDLPPEHWSEHYRLLQEDGITPMPTERIPLLRAFNEEQVRDQPLIILNADGTRRFILCSGQAMFDKTGQKLGAVVSMYDVTGQKRVEAELIKARDVAEAANRAKSVFLANMSHELRTPLNAVLGFAQLMRNAPDATERQVESLNVITNSGEHLLNLINNVLDISKIESGRVLLEESATDLHQLIHEMQSLMYVKAKEKDLHFTVDQTVNFPRNANVDSGKMRQVLINLIGNAIKFTSNGAVILRAMAVAGATENPGQMRVRFEVEDSGPGIQVEERERIFSPFVQVGERTPIETGTGLGLAISKQYVELMGGRIGVDSEPGKGSIFHFEMPVTVLPPEAVPVEPRRGRIIGLAEGQPRYRLLIAEDQPENRLLLRKLLEPFGFELWEATNGQEALSLFTEWRPHLIFMDIRMPVMNGLEAARGIKAADTSAQTRIVAITAHAYEEERREILAAGCDDFIRKPYHDVEIFDALTKHLGVRFIYEEETTTVPVATPVNATTLAGLPEKLLSELEQALVRIDIPAVGHVIEAIRTRDPALATALAAEATDLQFGRILRLIRSAYGETNPEEET